MRLTFIRQISRSCIFHEASLEIWRRSRRITVSFTFILHLPSWYHYSAVRHHFVNVPSTLCCPLAAILRQLYAASCFRAPAWIESSTHCTPTNLMPLPLTVAISFCNLPPANPPPAPFPLISGVPMMTLPHELASYWRSESI